MNPHAVEVLNSYKKRMIDPKIKDKETVAQEIWKHPLVMQDVNAQKRFNTIYESSMRTKFKPIK